MVGVEDDRVWRLARGHVVGGLLQLHHLLVGEEGEVVDERHAVQCLTVGADGRLRDPPSVYLDRLCLLADIAAEEGWKRGQAGGNGEGKRGRGGEGERERDREKGGVMVEGSKRERGSKRDQQPTNPLSSQE